MVHYEGAIPFLVRLVDDPFVVERDGYRSNSDRLRLPKRRMWHVAMEALGKLTGVTAQGASVVERRRFWRKWYAEGQADDR